MISRWQCSLYSFLWVVLVGPSGYGLVSAAPKRVTPSAKSAAAAKGKTAKGGGAAATAAAKALVVRGTTALAAGDLVGARRSLEEAYRTSRRPEVLYQLGRLALAAGRPVEAHDLLRRYLADPTREPDEEATKAAEGTIGQPLPAKGSIVILSDPGALVTVDEHVVGTLPLPLPLLVSAEFHTVTLDFPGKKLEVPVQVQSGRTSDVRVSRTSGAVLVSVLPAIVMYLEPTELPPDAKKALGDALEQAVHDEQQTLLDVDAALLQAPELKDCVSKDACLRQLAEKNKVDFVVVQRTQLEGKAQDTKWKTTLRLLRSHIVEPAATTEVTCEKCAPDAAAAQLKEATSKLLTDGLGRAHGQLRVTTEPAAATLRLGDRTAVPSPLETSLWAGSYQLTVSHPGYQPERRAIEVGSQPQLINVTLNREALLSPPPPPKQLQWESAPRPRWRLVAGAISLGLGVGLIGLGAVGIARDGACIDTPDTPGGACQNVYNTLVGGGVGIGLGAALAIGGTVLLSLPPPKRQVLVDTPTRGAATGTAGDSAR